MFSTIVRRYLPDCEYSVRNRYSDSQAESNPGWVGFGQVVICRCCSALEERLEEVKDVMEKRRPHPLYFTITLLILAVASLEAPELATLTNNTSNDPARIEITQEQVLRSAAGGQVPTDPPGGPTESCAFENPELFPFLPAFIPSIRPGRFLLQLFVLQRK